MPENAVPGPELAEIVAPSLEQAPGIHVRPPATSRVERPPRYVPCAPGLAGGEAQ